MERLTGSLGVLTGIRSNKMYLYGKPFQVVVDHEPLCTMYNKHSREVTVRVAKHKSKLLDFDFQVIYQPGATNPCDWASRCPPQQRSYTAEEREELGVEDEDENAEIMVYRMEELTDAVTITILQESTKADRLMQELMEDIKQGRLRKELESSGYKDCFQELSVHEKVIMRGDRILIPKALRADVLQAAHMGHPGKESMTRQLRRSCWWPKYSADIKDFQDFSKPCSSCSISSISVSISSKVLCSVSSANKAAVIVASSVSKFLEKCSPIFTNKSH